VFRRAQRFHARGCCPGTFEIFGRFVIQHGVNTLQAQCERRRQAAMPAPMITTFCACASDCCGNQRFAGNASHSKSCLIRASSAASPCSALSDGVMGEIEESDIVVILLRQCIQSFAE
jgi:hypothetical protein